MNIGAQARRPHLAADRFDDLLRLALTEIANHGEQIAPTKGAAAEVWGVTLELTNPISRISRTLSRGRLFSALGELCWYLSGTDDAEFITHYIKDYPDVIDGVVPGAYGPRLFGHASCEQFEHVVGLLERNPSTRRAVLQIYDREDIASPGQPPCTTSLQFLVREDRLHAITTMRSNDVIRGMAHDIFCFTMIQEILANRVGIPMGSYVHIVGSLHLYNKDAEAAEIFQNEGWQATSSVMEPMPAGDPRPAIEELLRAEATIRGDVRAPYDLPKLAYWADLARLLEAYALTRPDAAISSAEAEHRIIQLIEQLQNLEYRTYVYDKLDRLRAGL